MEKPVICALCNKVISHVYEHSDLYNLCVTVHTNCLKNAGGVVRPEWLFREG